MKIYSGYPGGITKISRDKDFYQTEDLSNVITVYVNKADVTGITYFLSLEFLRADGRKTTISTSDGFAAGDDTTYTEDGVTYDIHNFTLTETQLAVAGTIAFTCYINILNSGVVEKRGVLFNAVSNVRKTVTYSANTIFVVSEDEDDVPIIVADMKTAIEILSGQLASKVNKADVADNLTTNDSDKVLSAKQGYVLKALLDALEAAKADKSTTYTKPEIDAYKKMWDNLVYSCNFSIDDSAKTMTISGSWAFTKYSFVVINDIAVRTISYASLTTGNYCLVIRNNALEFVNFANAIQDGDMVLWIGFLSATGNIKTDIYRCNNKVTNLALSCSKNIKIDTINKNFVIPNGFLFWNSGYASITAQNISYADYLNATCVLVYRNGVFKVLLLQNIELFYNDVIVAIVWFRNDGFVLRKVYVVNETPDKAFTELPLSSKIFMRVGVIGDSYTSGWIKDNAHKNNPNYSWVKYMKQLTGNEWTNFGVSGSSTKSWVDGTLGQLPQVQTKGNKCQAYVIGLMINDQNQGMQTYVPLGTSSDIGTNENSYYAYYYKLINACLSVNSSAIIFCNTCPRTDGNFPSYNQAVIDVVNYCQNENKNVYLVELRNYAWSNETFTNDALNGHYTAIGYEYMAEIINKAFSDTINANASSLKEVNLIPYDSATVYDYVDQKINDLRWELGSHTLDVESDSDTSFSKSVPSGAIGCQINKVGGMSYKSENLLALQDVASTLLDNGVTYSITNGIITLSGTASADKTLFIFTNRTFNASTFVAKGFVNGTTTQNTQVIQLASSTLSQYLNVINTTTSITYSGGNISSDWYLAIVIKSGNTYTRYSVGVMLVSGSTVPTTWKQGFTGIRDSAVTSVVSKGANLLQLNDVAETTINGITYSINNGVFSIVGTASERVEIRLTSFNFEIGTYSVKVFDTTNLGNVNVRFFASAIMSNSNLTSTTLSNTFSVQTEVTSDFGFVAPSGATVNATFKYMLVKGSTAPTEYKPYITPIIKPIPSQIQALEGYGWGISESVCNYIDYDRKVFVQKVGKITITADTFMAVGTTGGTQLPVASFQVGTPLDMKSVPLASLSSLGAVISRTDGAYWGHTDTLCYDGGSTPTRIQYVNSNMTSEANAKAICPFDVYFELATPIETDISAYLTTDTIDVEPLGTIEFTNTYSQDVPSDIDYLIEEVKA